MDLLMNLVRLYNKMCCVMQWNIAFSKGNIEQMIREKKSSLFLKWMPLNDSTVSIADPFIFKDHEGNLNLLYEDFSMADLAKYGKIVLATLDKDFKSTGNKDLLDTKSHSSYPFVFVENEKTYVIPETSKQSKVSAYEYDFVNKSLINERVIMDNISLLDSTLFKHNGKYWLFAAQSDQGSNNSRLYIYFADKLFGKYIAHPNNPVKNNLDGSRPAGNIINVDGEIYRPAQNCRQHYGESISINRITKLSEYEFSEEFHFKIVPDKRSEFNSGIHTINVIDDIIAIDGMKMVFKPFTKWKLFFDRKLKKKI